jgi:hypothetical protein
MKKRNRANNYDWQALQAEYDTGLTIKQLATKHGMATRSFVQASKRGDFKTRNPSQAKKLKHANGYVIHFSAATRAKLSASAARRMHERKISSKRFLHNGIVLESTWEKQVAESLDASSIRWTRPAPLLYQDGLSERRYFPDFYLPDFNVYLDPKNDYLRAKDAPKLAKVLEGNNVRLFVLSKEQLSWHIIQQLISVDPAGGLQTRGL